MFLALASSGSIAAWAVFQKWPFLWGLIIAALQVATAIKDFLPYKKRLKIINGGLIYDLEDILNECEKRWFDVSNGVLTESEINDLHFEFRTRKTKTIKKHVANETLPIKTKYFEKAEEFTNNYFNNFFRGGNDS